MSKRLWLLKSEPEAFGWDDLVRDGDTLWDGVRNHRAANNLRAMQVGDRAFFYHSVTGKEIVGIMEVAEAGLMDSDDPKWASVRVTPVTPLARPVTLAEVKAEPALAEMELVRLSRLSVGEVTQDHWDRIIAMSKQQEEG
ncbi:ubiquinol-cytochrome C reductase [Croceibacterium mercuriale]|uniref:Ubiquinol-cytochrome C reductase n=1 Tax=Croceibacterium mercuriale TaxID=1572751 RepID=A0A0B2BW10_9SPHN|nr:EVE domain-containing protein [Croceibacterium mercuriale]KHL25624.1 ubiquinol-cytochrome C reductase [Croceibacterium mercuriale]